MAEIIKNRYQLTKHIGKGGMADVYLAFDNILKREVAIKILKSDMSDDEVALERFKREAGATTKLSHPNIVEVYDVGDDGDKHYIVMEYVRGYTLKQLIKKRGAIPYKETVWIIKQLASALMEAHRNNIIHRDVKSQNVLIKDDGTIKLSDFGIALASGSMQITSKDSVLGSVHYLAPELSKGKLANMQSDIYSLGIVMYELLTGDVPFKAENAIQVALKHIKQDIPSVRSINSEIPQSVENIIIKATAKSLNNRYQNVALMLKDLNECLKPNHLNDHKINFAINEKDKSENIHLAKEELPQKNKSKLSVVFLICASIISVIVLIGVLFFTGIIGNETKLIKVPDLTNLTRQEAEDLLADTGLEIDTARIEWEITENIDENLIISTIPEAYQEVEVGTSIKLIISSGKYSKLSNYVGKNYIEARDELRSYGFIVKTEEKPSDEKPGTVLEQSLEPGTLYDPNISNQITLIYTQEESIILPFELEKMDIDEAKDYLDDNALKYEFIKQDKSFFDEKELKDSKEYTVIRTNPLLGSSYVQNDENKIILYYYEGE